MTRHTQLVRPALVCLALGVGLGGAVGGCGGPAGSGTQGESEKVPEGIIQMKNAMKERAAAKKGRSGGPRTPPAGR